MSTKNELLRNQNDTTMITITKVVQRERRKMKFEQNIPKRSV